MIVAVDASYRDDATVAAAVLFERFEDAAACGERVALLPRAAEYVPGAFYERELPALLGVLDRLEQDAAACVRAMHGPYRISTMLRAVDRLCRA